jgi:hypothetical protein
LIQTLAPPSTLTLELPSSSSSSLLLIHIRTPQESSYAGRELSVPKPTANVELAPAKDGEKPGGGGGGGGKGTEAPAKGKEATQLVPYFSLFKYATGRDWAFMTVGTLGAAFMGVSLPLFSIAFGECRPPPSSFSLHLSASPSRPSSLCLSFSSHVVAH